MPMYNKKRDPVKEVLKESSSWTGTHHGSSRWSEFCKCPRAHRLRYVDGIRLKETPEYFELGSLVHTALELSALSKLEEFKWSVNDLLEEVAAQKLYRPIIIEEARRLLRAYFACWGHESNSGWDENYEILEVEHFVASNTLGPRYTGRVDLLLWAQDMGELVIVDHKTSAKMPGDADPELVKKFCLRPQFLGLTYCVREIEGVTPLFIVNLIVKTRIPQFRRIGFRITDEELDRWAEQHRAMIEAMSNGLPDWMNYSQCSPEIGPGNCWAIDWCHGSVEQRRELYVDPTDLVREKRNDGKKKKVEAAE